MTASAIVLAIVRFACWEAALFLAAIRLVRLLGWEQRTIEFWLAALAIQVTLESSIAAAFSFAGVNSQPAYWIAAAVCWSGACMGRTPWSAPAPLDPPSPSDNHFDQRNRGWVVRLPYALIALLLVPLVLLSFKPVEEIDSINYLHYQIGRASCRERV